MGQSVFCEYLKRTAKCKCRFVLLALAGALTSLTLVFPSLGLFEWITLIPLGIVLLVRAADRSVRLRSLYLDGLVFFYSFYLVAFHWFINLYPLDFIEGMTRGAAACVVCVAWFGLSLLQSAMGGLAFVAAGILFRTSVASRLALLRPLLGGAIWAVYEWTQTLGWWGVPWARLPIGQSKYLIGLQNASLFGSYFVTFVLVSVNFAFALLLLELTQKRVLCASAILACSLLVFQYASGGVLWLCGDVQEGKRLRVACIQGNISSAEKWDGEQTDLILSRYLGYSAEAAEEGAQLIVWAETAFPYNIDASYGGYSQLFCDFARQNQIYMIVGALEAAGEDGYFNTLFCFTPDGERLEAKYSKRHLVPFGEYVPMRVLIETLIPPLAELVLSQNDFVAGEGAQIIDIELGGENISLGGLICFDSIYEELTLETVRGGGELICLSTNDSWFTDSAALYMHNAQAQLRAIESGRYIARSANTGISTLINSRGEVLESLCPLEGGYIISDVYAKDSQTLFSIIGNFFVYFTALTMIFLVISDVIFANNKKRKQLDNETKL